MKRFDGKVRLFCLSNIMVSFIGTGFLGINGYTESIEGPVLSAHEISLTSSDTEPASRIGEGEENIYALITEGIKAVIEEQQDEIQQDEIKEEKEETTKKAEVKKADVKKANTKKSTSKKTSTKKSTSTKKTSSSKSSTKTVSYSKPSYSSVTGDAIVSFAKQFIGLRYVHAGRSLKTGTDCSGFTMLIYREFGVSLPPTVSGQTGKGTKVSKSNLQKGDLVFYKAKGSKGGASHVGIYIGGGQVIHESRPGVGVKISTVNMMQYVTARRVINSKAVKIAEQKKAEETKTVTDTANNTTTTSTQNNKNEGNVDNKVVNNNTTTTTSTSTNTQEVKVETSSTTTETPKKETKVEVKEEKKVEEKKEESKPAETTSNENVSE